MGNVVRESKDEQQKYPQKYISNVQYNTSQFAEVTNKIMNITLIK